MLSSTIRSGSFIYLFAFLATTSTPLTSQEVVPGSRMRVTLKAEPAYVMVGVLARVAGDTLYLRGNEEAPSVPLPLDTIRKIEISRGTYDHAAMGALIGAGLLGAIGLASGDDPPNQIMGWTAGTKALVGALAGAGIGGLLGRAMKSERWTAVPLTSLRIAPVSLNRIGFGVSLRF